MGFLSFDASSLLGWLFETTLYISILICLILALKAVIRGKLPAWWSYGLWLLLVLRMLIPWGVKSPFSIFNLFPAPPANEIYLPFIMDQIVSLPFLEGPTAIVTLDNMLLVLWFAGVLFFSITILSKNLRFWITIRRISPVTDRGILDLLEECRAMLSVRRDVKLIVSNRIKSPALFSYLKPRLLLPVNFLDAFEKDDLRCVFLHELGHLKNHDIGVSWLVSLLQVIYWFNPFVWYAFHHMRVDQEIACDAYVLSKINQIKPADYASTIVGLLERFIQNSQLTSLAGIIENNSQIKRRIALIMNYKKHTYKKTVTSVFMLFTVGLVFFTSSDGLSGVKDEKGANINKVDSIFAAAKNIAEVDQPPKILFSVPPGYPFSAKKEGVSGQVMLRFVIDSDGAVQEPTVFSAEPEGIFEEAALDAITQFKFQPAEKNGKPVACIVKMPIKFDLRPAETE